MSGIRIGLLPDFNAPRQKDGLRRPEPPVPNNSRREIGAACAGGRQANHRALAGQTIPASAT
jgi:hypothetical protein